MTASSTDTTGKTVTAAINGKNVTIATEDVTDLLVALLAARKEAYGYQRAARNATANAKKAEREAKKAARVAAAEAKKADRVAKLTAQLEALSA